MNIFANNKGQMAVELSFLLPVMIVVAVVAVNALSFAGECAKFDRVARNAVREVACTPALSSDAFGLAGEIQGKVAGEFAQTNESVEVWLAGSDAETVTYECKLTWSPTLFGMGLKTSVFAVQLFTLEHATQLSINPHQSGDIL